MDATQARNRANQVIWVGNDALYIWHKKEAVKEQIELPPAGPVPFVPRLHGIWEEASQKVCQTQLSNALGGRLRMRMSHILVAMPDDITWIETRALQDFFLMSGSGAPDKRVFFYPQSVLLGPSGESFTAVTWSCRCLNVCQVRNSTVISRIHLDHSHCDSKDLASAIKSISPYEHLPVYFPGIETTPIAMESGQKISLEQIAHL